MWVTSAPYNGGGSWTSAEMWKLKQANALPFFWSLSSCCKNTLPLLFLPSLLLPFFSCVLYSQSCLFKKTKKKTTPSPDHGQSWQVSCIFRFATVWLWRIVLLQDCFQFAEQIRKTEGNRWRLEVTHLIVALIDSRGNCFTVGMGW